MSTETAAAGTRIPRESRHDPPQVRLAHDWLVGMRGGEWVLDRLARRYGPTTIYTLVADGRPMTPAIDACPVVTSPLQRLPGASGRWRRWCLPLMPWAVGRLRVEPCDLLLSTSSAVMKSIRPPPGTPHLCYCHAPARYVWSRTSDYAVGAGGRVRGAALHALRGRLRRWDRRTADRVTRFIANSRHTASEIEACFGREATVIHPPVRVGSFTHDPALAREDWALLVSALEPYKRTDLAIEAARRADIPLRIVGDGSQRRALESSAGSTVRFEGRVDESRLLDLYRRARVLIFPQVEDFGIVAVEAQATGCPVIAFAAGGALETVTAETGILFEAQTPDAIVEAWRSLERRSFDPLRCRGNAERFAPERFDELIEEQVWELLSPS